MKKIKYFLLLMLVGILTLTGCGKKLTPEERLEKALNNLTAADSLTAKLKLKALNDDMDAALSMNAKVEKSDKGYNLYLGADVKAEADDEEQNISLEGYLLTTKKKVELYFMIEDYLDEWNHLKLDLDDLADEYDFDLDDIDLDDLSEDEIDMDIFKKIKEGKTVDGITEIKATIDAEEVEDIDGFDLEDDLKVIFYLDKKNNITKIALDLDNVADEYDFDKLELSIEISKINDTTVKVPKDVKEDAKNIDLEDLFEELFASSGGQSVTPTIIDNDYSTEDIFDDIIISARIKTCADGDFTVDFKNYNDELFLYDDEYDIKRIEEGVIKFTKADDECNFEITTPIVIDGKTCSIIDEYDSECK